MTRHIGNESMAQNPIAVVILTWNNKHYTLDCLRSLAEQTAPHTVYVVDNASSDDTVASITTEFPEVRIIANSDNLGFAGGNNVGLCVAFADGAETVLVLNNDTTLAPDALERLAEAAVTHPEAGILSPIILFAHSPHRVWFAGAVVNPWTGRSYHRHFNAPRSTIPADIQTIDRATGCAMLVTRACYNRIGGFDETFFMYYEDVDYSLRARDAGFRVLLVGTAFIYHHVSASAGNPKGSKAIYYGMRNGIVTMDRLRPLPSPVATARRLLMVLAMLCYLAKRPWGTARVRDIMRGYRDAKQPPAKATIPSEQHSPYYLRLDSRGAHMRMLSLVPPGQRALDVGCASGYLAQFLQQRGYRVVGVEIDPEPIERARIYCEEVYELSAECLDQLPTPVPPYDVILFGDVLEHLVHPERALQAVHRLLSPNGVVIISLPNIVFFSARLKILLGRFDYAREGLFDRTHMRFFTRRTATQLMESCGFVPITRDVTQGSPLWFFGTLLRRQGLEQTRLTRLIDRWDLWLSRHMPGLFGFQQLFVLRSVPEPPTDDPAVA